MDSDKHFFSIRSLRPKSLKTIHGSYSAAHFKKDLFSGATVGIVALPLAIVFAIGAGATPTQGLWTCIIAGSICALLSGSNVLVSGPTGALLVLTASILEQFGPAGLFYATLLSGILYILMGVAGIGKILRYMPYPVTTGFTTGIGCMIAVGQLKDFLGLHINAYPTDLVSRLVSIRNNIESFYYPACIAGLITILIILSIRRLAPAVPAAVAALVIVSGGAWLSGLNLPSIGSRFGTLPSGFPPLQVYAFSMELVQSLFPSALTLALLGSIITVMSSVVADGLSGDKHDATVELIAQGIGNMAASFFGGIPSTGAVARTVVNIKHGAVSPVSALVHSVVLLIFTLFLGNILRIIPLAALSGVLLVVAWDMSDMRRFFSMRYAPKSDLIVMLVTFFLAILINLSIAVEVGVLLAVLLFIKRITETSSIQPVFDPEDADTSLNDANAKPDIPKDVEVYEINGPFFFGTADLLQEVLSQVTKAPKVFILRMRRVPAIDATGLNALESFRKNCKKSGATLVLSGVREQPRNALRSIGMEERIGKENICPAIDAAIQRALEIIERGA